MRVLVVGAGGREHALCWKLAQSPRVSELLCAPGNGGIGAVAECVAVAADDVSGLVDVAKSREVDLVVVGPELPLTLGLVDALNDAGIRAFGPTRDGAQLEGSKRFTKELMRDAGVPSAAFECFTEAEAAKAYVREQGAPIVVKADGLAAGKGAIVCSTVEEACAAIDQMLVDDAFGEAGREVVIEEMLGGEEASFIAFTDGVSVLPLDSSQDHKRIFDGDRGPNTGGMGAYSPAPVVDDALAAKVVREVMQPVVDGLREGGIVYRGILYAGLMIEDGVARVLEFNARFGDPECQTLLVRLRSDLLDVIEAAIDGRLSDIKLEWDPRPSLCVVLASAGYPESARKGDAIGGIVDAEAATDTWVFHAGTKRAGEQVLTAGGRVLGVTAVGDSVESAREAAYAAVTKIDWDGMQYRNDIAARAIGRREASRS